MKVYARKLFPHDITHEVSVRTDIVDGFFGGQTQGLLFVGKKSGFQGEVTINSATDPRFGGKIKTLLTNEGRADVNDIVLIYKLGGNKYEIEIIKPSDSRFFNLIVLFRDKDRHAILEADDDMNIIGI